MTRHLVFNVGDEAKYDGTWAYIAAVHEEEREIILSFWRGTKTTLVSFDQITAVRMKRNRSRIND